MTDPRTITVHVPPFVVASTKLDRIQREDAAKDERFTHMLRGAAWAILIELVIALAVFGIYEIWRKLCPM